MAHKNLDEITKQLADFLTNDPACAVASQCLSRGVEIGVLLDDTVHGSFFRKTEGAGFEAREARSPDVVFHMNASAVEILAGQKGLNLGELGVEVLKLVVSKDIRVKVPGNLFGIMKNGYLGVVKEAGLPFAKYLTEHGVSNLSKIPEIIKKLKSK